MVVVKASGGRKLEGKAKRGKRRGRAAVEVWKCHKEEEIVVAVTGVELPGKRMAAAI